MKTIIRALWENVLGVIIIIFFLQKIKGESLKTTQEYRRRDGGRASTYGENDGQGPSPANRQN